MNQVTTNLASGDVVHVWLKPAGTASRATLRIEPAGAAPERLTVEGPTRGHLFATWTCRNGGPVGFGWAEDTDISVVYCFAPAAVAEEGIDVLWVSGRTRLGDDRYALHVQPPFGWMNDPNGLCEIGGLTHLFYQHSPHDFRWDTMHWGHAVSADGVRWTHLPAMLFPPEDIVRARDNQGGAFSGTALPRPDGSMRLFYTERRDANPPPRESQMTAVSRDGLTAGPAALLLTEHPPLPGFRDDWRDPFVFKGPDGGLKMLLGGADAGGSVVLLYATDNPEGAGGWRYVDVLFREPGTRLIPAECPSLIALEGEGAGLWVLLFGLIGSRDEATRRRNLTRTHIGRFDGLQFEPLHSHEIDFGTDCYAMQLWRGADGPRGIAWAANWTDVFADRAFPSAMTFPRRLLWRDGRLLTPPIDALDALRDGPAEEGAATSVRLRGGLAELELEVEPGAPFSVAFEHPTHEIALVSDGVDVELRFEPPGNRIVPRYRTRCPGVASLRLIVDVGLIEAFFDGGRACCTKRIDSAEPVIALRVQAEPGQLRRARTWSLRPANTVERP